jgi:hypothetical protein
MKKKSTGLKLVLFEADVVDISTYEQLTTFLLFVLLMQTFSKAVVCWHQNRTIGHENECTADS